MRHSKPTAGYLGYQHWWTDNLRSTLVAGSAALETLGFQPGNSLDNSQFIAGNLIWSPVPDVNPGVELLYGRRENKNGETARRNACSSRASSCSSSKGGQL